MKRFLLLCAACAAMTLHAGSAADYGNLAAALEETDPVERLGALLHALEVTNEAAPELIRSLNMELEKSGCKDDTLKRLLAVWNKRPADLRSSRLVMLQAMQRDMPPEVLVKFLEASLRKYDLNKKDREGRKIYFEFLEVAVSLHQGRYDSGAAGNLLKYLADKYPHDPRVAAVAAEVLAHACFIDTDTAPGLRNWEDLTGENRWKAALEKLQDRAGDMVVEDRDDAVALSKLAFILRDRDLLKKAIEIRRGVPVPDEEPSASVTAFAIAMKMPELLGYIKDELKVYVLAGFGDFEGAEKAMEKSAGTTRMREELVLAGMKKDFQKVRELLIAGKVVPFSRGMFFAGCEAAIDLHDTKLLDVVISHAGKVLARPDIANLFGYSCVILNHRLADAEIWLKSAMEQQPGNSSYLDSYAWLLFRKGEYRKAREIIGEALKNRVPDASVSVLLLHAAEIELAATGDKTAARNYLQRAEKLCTPAVSDWREEDVKRVKELLK